MHSMLFPTELSSAWHWFAVLGLHCIDLCTLPCTACLDIFLSWILLSIASTVPTIKHLTLWGSWGWGEYDLILHQMNFIGCCTNLSRGWWMHFWRLCRRPHFIMDQCIFFNTSLHELCISQQHVVQCVTLLSFLSPTFHFQVPLCGACICSFFPWSGGASPWSGWLDLILQSVAWTGGAFP